MINYYKSLGGYYQISQPANGCWINVVNPSDHEIESITAQFSIPEDIVKDILDVEERPRIEYDEHWTLIITRIPIQGNGNLPFFTVPLGIFITTEHTISICLQENEILPSVEPSLYRGQKEAVKDVVNFVLNLFYKSGTIYMLYLKQIYQQLQATEAQLEQDVRNEHLKSLLKIEKSLVYFITALKGNEIVLLKFKNTRLIQLSESNEDLLEDATIEIKQALEMSEVYSNIQHSMRDTFSSVISNNLNLVMKQLTGISIILMIPTLVASFFGMNVINYLEKSQYAILYIIFGSAVFSYLGYLIFRRKEWF